MSHTVPWRLRFPQTEKFWLCTIQAFTDSPESSLFVFKIPILFSSSDSFVIKWIDADADAITLVLPSDLAEDCLISKHSVDWYCALQSISKHAVWTQTISCCHTNCPRGHRERRLVSFADTSLTDARQYERLMELGHPEENALADLTTPFQSFRAIHWSLVCPSAITDNNLQRLNPDSAITRSFHYYNDALLHRVMTPSKDRKESNCQQMLGKSWGWHLDMLHNESKKENTWENSAGGISLL